MKRIESLALSLSVVLVLCCATACTAQDCPMPSGSASMQMYRGWYMGEPAWFLGLSTSHVDTALGFGVIPSPKLESINAVSGGAAKMYVATSGESFVPVFSTAPGLADYSGVWDTQFVVWKPGVTPWIITRTDVVGVPPGLPDATQADIVDTNFVFDLAIAAVGPLGGPWYPAPPGRYRIRQATVEPNYTYTKLINLPTFDVFCKNEIHRRVTIERALITDASDPDLAACLGANYAPALADADPANTQRFLFIQGGPYNCQKPVLEYCPYWLNRHGISSDFSPVMEFVRLTRSGSLPPWSVINNPEFVDYLIGVGLLTPLIDDAYINVHPLRPQAG